MTDQPTSTDITVAQPTGLAILDLEDSLEIIRDTLDEGDNILGMLPRGTITATGPAAFQVGDDTPKDITGVIVDAQIGRRYYESDFSGGNEPPDCSSADGKTGYGFNGPGGNEGRACATCPMNQFIEGGGKPCRESYTVAIIPPGDLLPVLVNVPAASMRAFKTYKIGLATRAPFRRLTDVVTTITVEKGSTKNRSGINVLKFTTADTLPDDARAKMAGVAQALRPVLERTARLDAGQATGGADYEAEAA